MVLTWHCLETGLATVDEVVGRFCGHIEIRIVLIRETVIYVAREHVDIRRYQDRDQQQQRRGHCAIITSLRFHILQLIFS